VPQDVEREIVGLSGRRGSHHLARLLEAAEDFDHERDRRALRTLRELRDAVPDSPSVRELLGLTQYRLGNYRAAAKELEAFIELTGSVEQHPVLMDCYRAQHRWAKVEQLWQELAAASPSAQLVAEGRIVAAGALADRGRVTEAVSLLSRKADAVKRPREHHLRLWYALADLEERAGDHARARALFARVAAHDPQFADVSDRQAALG
jgi:tetratricopeptide (TPR) repeat protein